MLFKPYRDEYDRINSLKPFISNDYSIIRLTKTMISKNNIDANYFLRSLLKNKKVVDYDNLQNGGKNGLKYPVIMYSKNQKIETTINFYKVTGKRSDPRFGLYHINNLKQRNILGIGDLLVLVPMSKNQKIVIYIFNASFDLPDQDTLSHLFDLTPSQKLLHQIFPKIKKIAQQGYHANTEDNGTISPKDADDTLETLLNIETKNQKNAEINGLIEVKSKKSTGLETLFT